MGWSSTGIGLILFCYLCFGKKPTVKVETCLLLQNCISPQVRRTVEPFLCASKVGGWLPCHFTRYFVVVCSIVLLPFKLPLTLWRSVRLKIVRVTFKDWFYALWNVINDNQPPPFNPKSSRTRSRICQTRHVPKIRTQEAMVHQGRTALCKKFFHVTEQDCKLPLPLPASHFGQKQHVIRLFRGTTLLTDIKMVTVCYFFSFSRFSWKRCRIHTVSCDLSCEI